jgi:hypothetical protein
LTAILAKHDKVSLRGITWRAPGRSCHATREQSVRPPAAREPTQPQFGTRPCVRWDRIGPAPGGTSEEQTPVPTKLSDADRQARREADREKAAAAVEALTTSEGWQAWLSLRRHFRTYSANNQFLIALQCDEATYVPGFRKWLQLGYAVRRGETAIRIWMPMPPSTKALAEWEAAGAVKTDNPKPRFRLGPVFDTLSRDRWEEHRGSRAAGCLLAG